MTIDQIKARLDTGRSISDANVRELIAECEARGCETRAAEAKAMAAINACDFMWVVLANVSEGNWEKQGKDWQEAAAKARDGYFKALASDDQKGGV